MRLATVRTARGPRAALFWPARRCWVDVSAAAEHFLGTRLPSGMKALLTRDGPSLSTCRRVLVELSDATLPLAIRSWDMEAARLAPPVPLPGSFIDFYAFEEHVRSARARRGLDMVPEWYRYPVYYRSNHRSLVGSGEEVWFPAGEGRLDYELEIAAVLGAHVESPTPHEAETAIAGYCLLNDWSARCIQAEVMKVGLGPSKGKDFATSIGPWLVTPDELGDVRELALEARVNGEVRSRGVVGAMNWSWGELLAFAGEGVRFEPGDIFGSGTVGGGCGLEHDRYLSPGDVVECDGGAGLGVLRNTVRQREAP